MPSRTTAPRPRSLGRAEADRLIEPLVILRRTLHYGLAHCPELDRAEQYARCRAHLHEKYGEGGYLRLWLPDTENARALERLRRLLDDEAQLRTLFERLYDEESGR